MIKVLFLTSNPEGTPPLKLDEEARLITQKIRAAEYRDVLKLETLWAVRPDDLLQALNEHKPEIVHFSGHGSKIGEIVLMDNNRQVKPVSAEALKMLFTTLKDNIRVVVLNACYSQIQAKAISEVIDCVVGMNTSIGDEAAIIFAASFYRAIGFGRSIKEAFDQGKTAIMLEGIPEASTPQLLTRMGVDPSSIVLIQSGEGETPVAATKVNQQITGNQNIFSATGDVTVTFGKTKV
jgi:hypothetical protein